MRITERRSEEDHAAKESNNCYVRTGKVLFVKADVELNQQFENICDLEFNDSIYDPKTSMSQNNKRALDVMESTAKLTNGHYEIALLWKNYPPCLKNS